LRVAVVEDEGVVALDIKRCLQNFGFIVDFIADTGEKAIEMLQQAKPDVVLLDVILKGKLDGIEAGRIILEKYNVPVLFLTALEDDDNLERINEVTSVKCLFKPFDDNILKSSLEKTVEQHKSIHLHNI
jgi:CheY-like chemotaxis protein